jgi:peptide/nickel transport system permease protein
MMLEVLRQDYIRTAWAKGLKERVVVIRHGLKNALIPVVTIIGGQIATVLAGTVIIENIFSLPGIGQLIINATLQRDYTMVSGVLLLFAIVMVVVNLAVDVAYGFIDPRVHYK